jgi:hypothetical protein
MLMSLLQKKRAEQDLLGTKWGGRKGGGRWQGGEMTQIMYAHVNK